MNDLMNAIRKALDQPQPAKPPDAVNQRAAMWWACRFEVVEKRAEFEKALAELLPDCDWQTESDYDPDPILLTAIRSIGLRCAGVMFSSRGLLPEKHRLHRYGDRLLACEGYGKGFHEV